MVPATPTTGHLIETPESRLGALSMVTTTAINTSDQTATCLKRHPPRGGNRSWVLMQNSVASITSSTRSLAPCLSFAIQRPVRARSASWVEVGAVYGCGSFSHTCSELGMTRCHVRALVRVCLTCTLLTSSTSMATVASSHAWPQLM